MNEESTKTAVGTSTEPWVGALSSEVEETWEPTPSESPSPLTDGITMDVDIACVGFGPAMGGFLTALTQEWSENPGDPAFESKVLPGTPIQVLCFERADDLAAGVSGVVTRARGIRFTFPNLKPEEIPMAAAVKHERVLYLLDPVGASRRSVMLRGADFFLRLGGRLCLKDHAFELPWTPKFLRKHGGLVLSIGQFNQWVASQLMANGLVQIWPASPVKGPLFAGRTVVGLRLVDQGVDKKGVPADGFMPGMDVHARLTVVGDGPAGAVGRMIDDRLGMPEGHARRDWAMGMKFVIELPADEDNADALDKGSPGAPGLDSEVRGDRSSPLQPGTVWHTFGYPEPEIFGFLYVHPDRLVSVGIFVPSWMGNPARTCYRYLQHFIQHPALWRYLKNGTLRSWGAKSLEESGRRGEPFLVGNGYARIGEGSGSTNMLTGSGVDEAWTTGTQLAQSVIELLRAGKPFTQQNLTVSYVSRRRASWIETAAREAEDARNGFHGGILRGLFGMALAGLTGGHLHLKPRLDASHKQIKHAPSAIEPIDRKRAAEIVLEDGRPFHDALMSARGWPEVAFDGRLLVSQQDALLMGGKVQALPGFADHVVFRDLRLCAACDEKTCIAMCSGQAITLGTGDLPVFEREKCVHCGGCLWNCAKSADGKHNNLEFKAGCGGLHSAEN